MLHKVSTNALICFVYAVTKEQATNTSETHFKPTDSKVSINTQIIPLRLIGCKT